MNARLKPIETRVIERPAYDNHHLGYEADWIRANADSLRAWWNECVEIIEEPLPADDFEVFCRAQHDIQLSLRTAYRETHSKWRDG